MKQSPGRYCKACFDPDSDFNEEIEVVNAGDESWDVCPSCRGIEQDTIEIEEEDPTPWCSACQVKSAKYCHCGPIAENE